MRVERGLAYGLAATVSLLALEPALAQSDSQKIEQLQRQTDLLEKQLKALKDEIAQTRKKAEKVESVQAGYAAQTPPPSDPKSPGVSTIPRPKCSSQTRLARTRPTSGWRPLVR